MRLALYAHHSEHASVAEHVIYYLEQLHALGFQICFVSNSPLSEESKCRIRPFSVRVRKL
jgi:rhamnosyltransferase